MVNTYDELAHKFGSNCKVSITDCEDSNIYIDSSVEALQINSCANCTIFVAAVSKVCTLEKCENVTLCVASNELRIGNCVDSVIHSYTPSFPPIVYGDTRNLRMAPHNATYQFMTAHLQRAGIPFQAPDSKPADWFLENINNFRKPITFQKGNRAERAESQQNSHSFTILPVVDFTKLVLPISMQDTSTNN